MTVLLALENALQKRIKYAVGHSAVVFRMAETLAESGVVAQDVNIIVRFKSSTMPLKNDGANIPTVRVKNVRFEVEVRYRQLQRVGHSFALAILDAISNQVNGYVPDLTDIMGKNSAAIPGFQTGFELVGESYKDLEKDSTIYAYVQEWEIKIIQGQAELSPLPCPIDYDNVSLKSLLPCVQCLKTSTGVLTGIAKWTGVCETDSPLYLYDPENCPPRPLDRINVVLGDPVPEEQENVFHALIQYIPLNPYNYQYAAYLIR